MPESPRFYSFNIIGYDRTGQDAKFIYDYGNGESKEISENAISLFELFNDKYKDWS